MSARQTIDSRDAVISKGSVSESPPRNGSFNNFGVLLLRLFEVESIIQRLIDVFRCNFQIKVLEKWVCWVQPLFFIISVLLKKSARMISYTFLQTKLEYIRKKQRRIYNEEP